MAIVKDCIIGASYNKEDNSSIAQAKVVEKAEDDLQKGSKCVSHNIYRCDIHYDGQIIDNLKFIYPIRGTPGFAYTMRNVLGSESENNVVVGSTEIEKIFGMSRDFHADLIEDKSFEFVHEGHNLSLSNTIIKGNNLLKELTKNKIRTICFIPGDVPFCANLKPILNDPDALIHDLVLDFNSRERIFEPENIMCSGDPEFFIRNWYRKITETDGRTYSIKEANIYLIKPENLDEKLLNFIYGTRKGGQLTKLGIILFALANRISHPILLGKALYNLARSSFTGVDIQAAESIGELLTLGRVRVKARHTDVNRLADIDSLEDWRYYEEISTYAVEKKGSLSYIYPYARDIEAFRKEYARELQKTIPMLRDFEGFINSEFRKYDLPEPYINGRLVHQLPESQLETAVEHMHKKLVLPA